MLAFSRAGGMSSTGAGGETGERGVRGAAELALVFRFLATLVKGMLSLSRTEGVTAASPCCETLDARILRAALLAVVAGHILLFSIIDEARMLTDSVFHGCYHGGLLAVNQHGGLWPGSCGRSPSAAR